MKKRRVFLLIAVVLLAFSVASTAFASIGSWTKTLSNGESWSGTVWQTKDTYSSAIVLNTTVGGSNPGYVYRAGTSTPASVRFKATVSFEPGHMWFYPCEWTTGPHNQRTPGWLYDSAIRTGDSWRLDLSNTSGYALDTKGTWSPDY